MESLTIDQILEQISEWFHSEPHLNKSNNVSALAITSNDIDKLCGLLCKYYIKTKKKPIKDVNRIRTLQKQLSARNMNIQETIIFQIIEEVEKIGFTFRKTENDEEFENRLSKRTFNKNGI